MSQYVRPPKFVRWVGDDERREDLVNEAKARTWVTEAEHAILTLETGERPMVSGRRDGIRFDVEGEGPGETIMVDVEGRRVRVSRVEWHTHPRVTGLSDGVREAIFLLKQAASLNDELGRDRDGTIFGPDKSQPDG